MTTGQEVKLFRWADRMQGKPFVWGETDCACIVLRALDDIYGSNIASCILGQYKTLRGALRHQARESLADILGRVGYTRHEKPRTGDVLLVDLRPWIRGHICLGAWCLTSNQSHGVYSVPTRYVMAHRATVCRV